MPADVKCFDHPPTIFRENFCLNALSKDIRGDLRLIDRKERRCSRPECRTLRTIHRLKVAARAHRPCDSRLGRALNGTIVVERLISAFDQDGEHRGVHAGDFEWTGSGARIKGRMSGITNAGTHREPAFQNCQRCDERGVMEGRLCGKVVETQDAALRGCQIIAAYRIRFDPSAGGGEGAVLGTLEGVIICPCRP